MKTDQELAELLCEKVLGWQSFFTATGEEEWLGTFAISFAGDRMGFRDYPGVKGKDICDRLPKLDANLIDQCLAAMTDKQKRSLYLRVEVSVKGTALEAWFGLIKSEQAKFILQVMETPSI